MPASEVASFSEEAIINEIESSLSSREVLNSKKKKNKKIESMECQQIYSKDSLSSIYYILSSLGTTMFGNTQPKTFKMQHCS